MSGLLIDTHVLLWWAESPEQLSPAGSLAIASGRNQLYFSHASIWELNIKISLGRITVPEDTDSLMLRSRCNPLPIQLKHLEAIKDLPHLHGDPFDRLLIAQAREESLTLVTRDRQISKYDVPILVA